MLREKPYVQAQSIPGLFKAIIQNDELRRLTKSSQVVNFAEHKRLRVEHMDYMRAAEKATAGTKNKGTEI
jgi:hypothetical protein